MTLASDGPPGNSSGRLALMIDLERCIGCKSCEVACKQEHGLGPGEYRNRALWLGDPDGPALDFLTVACQHCDRPACLRACPVNPKAITKDPETASISVIIVTTKKGRRGTANIEYNGFVNLETVAVPVSRG